MQCDIQKNKSPVLSTCENRVAKRLANASKMLAIVKIVGWYPFALMAQEKNFHLFIDKSSNAIFDIALESLKQYRQRLQMTVEAVNLQWEPILRNPFITLSENRWQSIKDLGRVENLPNATLYEWYSDPRGECHLLDWHNLRKNICQLNENPLYIDVQGSAFPFCECEDPNVCNCGSDPNTSLVEVFETFDRGFGLRCMASLPYRHLIGEYIGEIVPKAINQASRQREIHSYDLDGHLPNDHPAFYIIRAEKFGNYTRFINHSCEPNVESVAYNKNGVAMIGIVTIKATKLGEELTMDYGEEYWRGKSCKCGSERCRFA